VSSVAEDFGYAQTRSPVPAQPPEPAPPPVEPPPPAPAPVPTAQIIVHPIHVTPRDPRLVLHLDPGSERAAAFRVVRHRLDEKKVRVVCVTSPNPSEGKTTLALNLSLALGECGRARVALLEANLRTPSLATILEVIPPICFGEQLVQHRLRPLEPWYLIESLAPSLHLGIVRAEVSGRPLLDTMPWQAVVATFKSAYDYVVIDTASVLGSADVNIVQEGVDAILMAGIARRTRLRDLRRASEQLHREKILGTVLLGGR
jgi:Mrp family chromosome partitioning ATPase